MTPTQQPISDDQELAKVLAGVNQEADAAIVPSEDPAAPTTPAPSVTDDLPMPPLEDTDGTPAPTEEPAEESAPAPEPLPEPTLPDPVMPSVSPAGDDSLDAIKKEAIQDLRPLVDKLNIAPDEKFDTLLLLLRSTDDKGLIPSAYDAAKNIPDEARRAQALLDVIKEIDYLSSPK